MPTLKRGAVGHNPGKKDTLKAEFCYTRGMKQYRKVACMVLAVLAPFAALSLFALIEMSANARQDIERTISAKVNGCLAATEREAARHIADLDTAGAWIASARPLTVPA